MSRASLCPSPSHTQVSRHGGPLTTLRVHSASLSPEFSHKPRWPLLPSVSPTCPSLFTPPGTWRPYLCLYFLAPCLSLHQPTLYYQGLQLTSGTHPSIQPAPKPCFQDLHNFLPNPTLPYHLPVKGTEHTFSPAGASNSHHSLHPGPRSLRVFSLKPFLCRKGQLSPTPRALRDKLAPSPLPPKQLQSQAQLTPNPSELGAGLTSFRWTLVGGRRRWSLRTRSRVTCSRTQLLSTLTWERGNRVSPHPALGRGRNAQVMI